MRLIRLNIKSFILLQPYVLYDDLIVAKSLAVEAFKV